MCYMKEEFVNKHFNSRETECVNFNGPGLCLIKPSRIKTVFL